MTELQQQIQGLPRSLPGRLLYYLIPYRRKVIRANVDQVYAEKLNEQEKKKLIQAYYSHLATSLKEALQLRFMSLETLGSKVEVRGAEHMLSVVAKGKGVLVVTGHFGNWEFAPLGGVLHFQAYKNQFHFIRRTLGLKVLERTLFRRYYQAGLQVIPKKNALEKVQQALEHNHAVIFVLDQHASVVNKDGIAVEFFGKKAGTYRSLATLSRHTGIPVVPAAGFRLANGKHVLEFFPAIPWQDYPTNQESLYHNTLAYNKALEKIILAHPEQWNWLHKRWKLPTSGE